MLERHASCLKDCASRLAEGDYSLRLFVQLQMNATRGVERKLEDDMESAGHRNEFARSTIRAGDELVCGEGDLQVLHDDGGLRRRRGRAFRDHARDDNQEGCASRECHRTAPPISRRLSTASLLRVASQVTRHRMCSTLVQDAPGVEHV